MDILRLILEAYRASYSHGLPVGEVEREIRLCKERLAKILRYSEPFWQLLEPVIHGLTRRRGRA